MQSVCPQQCDSVISLVILHASHLHPVTQSSQVQFYRVGTFFRYFFCTITHEVCYDTHVMILVGCVMIHTCGVCCEQYTRGVLCYTRGVL